MRSLLRRAADLGGPCVRLDLSGCDRVDPLVRRCLAEEARRLRRRGGRLVCPDLLDLLDLLDLPDLVDLVGRADDGGPTGVEAADRPCPADRSRRCTAAGGYLWTTARFSTLWRTPGDEAHACGSAAQRPGSHQRCGGEERADGPPSTERLSASGSS
ncbi:hypothetical protein [uncultured Pseudokineococcus sp.]|uniref:hypothetical protein n=1 Tax=uncultured Pseudokineococcus sp. TaxID=1642928 RepID=UPI002619C525|nr:hypothetical protein [uncultured Pseudokineococcus sp.]